MVTLENCLKYADVMKLVNIVDSKSTATACGFKSHHQYQTGSRTNEVALPVSKDRLKDRCVVRYDLKAHDY